MKILVLNGSPHGKGNTAALTGAFVEGAESKGHEVTVIQVGTKKIGGCKACEYCHTKGNGACIQQDDMGEVYEALKDTDLLVLASPVYYFGWSGQLQDTISRFYPMGKVAVKKGALILSSASPNVYDGPVAQYRNMLRYFGAEDAGVFTFHGEENQSEQALTQVREFGASL